MNGVSFERVYCPYCGEAIELTLDASAGEQVYVEDCSVCCRPIDVRVRDHGAGLQIGVRRDDE